MKTLLAILLFSAPSLAADNLSIDMIVAIAKAKLKPVPGAVPTTAQSKVEWSDYSDAYALHIENGQPLVVLVSASWCGPCKMLKEAIEKEAIAGINYAYVDVDESPEVVKLLGFTGQFNIPQLKIYYPAPLTDQNEHWTGTRLGNERPKLFEAFRKAVKACRQRDKDVSAPIKPEAKQSYTWKVNRISPPAGYGPAYVEGSTYYDHVTRDHGNSIREVLNRVNIRGMSDRDLFALHGMLHSGLSVGHWDGSCLVFTLP